MFAKERQDQIYAMLRKDGAVTTAKLVSQFEVSIETIRRDLLQLEQAGKLRRVHGGAIPNSNTKPYPELAQRNKEYQTQKTELSQQAANFVCEGDILAIDSGSTAISLAQVLKERFQKLTVITHSLDVFEILHDHRAFSVILCGGWFLNQERAFHGPLTLGMLQSLHSQKAFIFASAISLKTGICDHNPQLHPIQQQLLRTADQVFILADNSKFEKSALLKVDDMRQEYIYVTDSGLSTELMRLYKENNIQIITG